MRVRSVLVAGTAVLAILAGTLPAQGAPPEDDAVVEPAAGIAGIEGVGPIPTVGASGPARPELPDTVATVPGGVARHGEFPWLKVDALATGAQEGQVPARVTARVYDLSLGRGEKVGDADLDYAWEGDLVRGWGQINERLTGLAVKRLGRITEDSDPEDLKPIAALVATGNEASKTALALVGANKTAVQQEESEAPERIEIVLVRPKKN